MANNKITIELGLIRDAEVLRALENFQKVIGDIGDTSKVFGDKLGIAGKDLTELARNSSAAAKEFKNLNGTMNDADKAMSQGLLDERKVQRLDALRVKVSNIATETDKLTKANLELARQEQHLTAQGKDSEASKINEQRQQHNERIFHLQKEASVTKDAINSMSGGFRGFMENVFGKQEKMAGGQLSLGN